MALDNHARPSGADAEIIAHRYAIGRYVYFDIETIPDQAPDALDRARRQVKAPASLKKRESIDAWLAENSEEAAREILHKTGRDGATGHVCTIAWANNGGEIEVRHAESRIEEEWVIREFFEALEPYHAETLVGHNIAGFDLPFLLKRAVILGIPLPPAHKMPRDPKPWGSEVFDTMTAWAGSRDRISLDRLCGALGFHGKDGFDGSMVAEAWAAGEHRKIVEYCRDDVDLVRRVHQRFLRVDF